MSTRLFAAVTLGALAPLVASAQSDPRPAPPAAASTTFDVRAQAERQDLGVAPSAQLHAGAMHGPTPATIPGGQVVTTKGLASLVRSNQARHVLFDVLGGPDALPNAQPAAWMSQPGSFDDAVQQQVAQTLAQETRGRKDTVLVFYCLSRECWMSYNAALRAIHARYTNVLWYRGGIEAWKAAGLPTQPAGQPGYGPSVANALPPSHAPQMAPMQTQMPSPMPSPKTPPAQPLAGLPRGKFDPITPVMRDASAPPRTAGPSHPAGELRIGQGRFFSFALPPGWRVGEDGQFALTLLAPDSRALTLVVGNAGMQPGYPPARYAYEKLSAMQPQNLQLGEPRPARPASGFGQALEFDVSYRARGAMWRGRAKVSVAPAYESATMALTAALAESDQWPAYASWLPQVADQVSALNGAAFGARGVMQQNLQNSVAYGEAARQYRDWSQKNWQQVTDERNASQDRRSFAVRENLGNVQTFANPYGTPPVELPTSHKYFWTNPQGQVVGTNDPSANPNAGSTAEWRKMERVGR